MEKLLKQILNKLDSLEKGQKSLEDGQKNTNSKLETMQGDINNLQKDMTIVKESIMNNKIEHDACYKHLEEKVDLIYEVVNHLTEKIQVKITTIERECGYFTRKIGEHEKEIDIVKERIQS